MDIDELYGGIGEEQEPEEKKDNDEQLDIYSDLFDPLLALQAGIVIPAPDAKPHDNIHVWKSASECKSQAQGTSKSQTEGTGTSQDPGPSTSRALETSKPQVQGRSKSPTPGTSKSCDRSESRARKISRWQPQGRSKSPTPGTSKSCDRSESRAQKISRWQAQGRSKSPTPGTSKSRYRSESRTRGACKSARDVSPEPIKRRWLPHQLPVQGKRKPVRNVFTRMENIKGPLERLKTCVEKRTKIKVSTRRGHEMRGYCTAYVVAFDKHWNLALEDVEEVWFRKKKRKIPALDSAMGFKCVPKVLPPPITILYTTKKTETCSRHVNQLMMRGEHVAYIAVMKDRN